MSAKLCSRVWPFFFREVVESSNDSKTALTRKPSKKQKLSQKATVMRRVKNQNFRTRSKCETFIDELSHAQGEAYTLEENKQALLSFYIAKKKDASGGGIALSRDGILDLVAAQLGRGKRELASVVKMWEQEHAIKCSDDSKRGMFRSCCVLLQ